MNLPPPERHLPPFYTSASPSCLPRPPPPIPAHTHFWLLLHPSACLPGSRLLLIFIAAAALLVVRQVSVRHGVGVGVVGILVITALIVIQMEPACRHDTKCEGMKNCPHTRRDWKRDLKEHTIMALGCQAFNLGLGALGLVV